MLDTKTQDQKLYNEPGEDSFWSLMLFFFSQKEDPEGPINTSPGLHFTQQHLPLASGTTPIKFKICCV